MARTKLGIGTRQETRGPQAPAAVTVMASELLSLTPEDTEKLVENEVDTNLAIEKSDKDEDGGKQYTGRITYGVSAKAQEMFERKTAYTETLIEHMEEQISSSTLNERQRIIAGYVVGSLDRNGYLRDDPYYLADDISFNENENYEESEVVAVLKAIQQMDPVGIGARDLKECLLLQLAHRHTPLTPLATRIVEKCFKDFLNNRRDHIAKSLGVTVDEVNEVYEREIRKLDPKPAGAFDNSDVDSGVHITPTFIVEVEDDQITFEIPNRIPELYISESFKDAVDNLNERQHLNDKEKEDKKNMAENMDKAEVFISALQMRQETLRQTMEAIIHVQREFFLNNGDDDYLKPMKLEDLARITGRNTSVMSRATSGKYISTPWGLMPMRELFSEGGKQVKEDGSEETVSTRAIKKRLKAIVDGEDKSKPLSDDALCAILKKEGYKIERRTVAKYRGLLNIPKAALRRKFTTQEHNS